MLSKDHELTPAQIDEILERTAHPLSAHKSNDFGHDGIDEITDDDNLFYLSSQSKVNVILSSTWHVARQSFSTV